MAGQVKGAVWKQYVRNMGVHLAIAILSGFRPVPTVPVGEVINFRTSTVQKLAAVPRRARISGS